LSGGRIRWESCSAGALDTATVISFFIIWTPALTRGPIEQGLFHSGLKILKQWHVPKISAKNIIKHHQTLLLTYNLFILEMETSIPAYLQEHCLHIPFHWYCKIRCLAMTSVKN
jgi:hypothetical protein